MKHYLTSVAEIWDEISKGKKVYWVSETYEVMPEVLHETSNKFSANPNNPKQGLRVTCVSNWFGSLLHPGDVKHCYVNDWSKE